MKTTEEKIDEIHDAVIQIKSDMAAGKIVCANVHEIINGRLEVLHRAIKGNGQPGLEQKHQDLVTRFDKFETKIIIWASVATFAGQIILPRFVKAIGWG